MTLLLISQINWKSEKENIILQGMASFGSVWLQESIWPKRPKSDPPPVFVHKVWLEYSYHDLFVYFVCSYFYIVTSELSNCGRDHLACKT